MQYLVNFSVLHELRILSCSLSVSEDRTKVWNPGHVVAPFGDIFCGQLCTLRKSSLIDLGVSELTCLALVRKDEWKWWLSLFGHMHDPHHQQRQLTIFVERVVWSANKDHQEKPDLLYQRKLKSRHSAFHFHVGQGSHYRPVNLGRKVGPSAIR